MLVGLVLRLTTADSVLNLVSFDPQFFFNLLLPPIILASGYELHQGNFFRHIGTILTFAFAGTFISALVLAVILYVWALIPIEAIDLSFVEALSVGATLSATDPVTILAIFNTYKVDPSLYTVIFGESILNDAIAIVLFDTAQRHTPKEPAEGDKEKDNFTILTLIEAVGDFLLVFFGSLVIGLAVGIGTSLLLKFTRIRKFPKIESCIIFLIAYASYFFANAVHMSGIVSLLFCGICLKHYAYHNMSRRTQLTVKFMFQILAQLSENFIFVYLGLSLFTEQKLYFRPLFILITVVGVCGARYLAIFPLSAAINWFIRYRARRAGTEAEEMPFAHKAMLYWAGLRGAVGVALAAGLTGPNSFTLKATILVVVVLTVIIFGGTTARMLEILNIKTGVVEDVDSDDEFDIEVVGNGSYIKRSGSGYGHNPKTSAPGIPLSTSGLHQEPHRNGSYSSGNARRNSSDRPRATMSRTNSSRSPRDADASTQGLLSRDSLDEEDEAADLDLPPSARPSLGTTLIGRRGDPPRAISAPPAESTGESSERPHSGGGIRHFLSGSTDDAATWFKNIDEGFIKPKLLLDPGDGSKHGPGNA
ncbi:MAG: monovalent cation:H+ antiporter, CPA1 (nhx1) [Alyxoria varia]|nr:MAG: monovalent cation:H+ antiporter, CPA1 (nhx1) [Alyxoria varia]